MSDDEPQRGTKAWVRYHWDEEHNTAPKQVLLIKLLHEYHIIIPGLVAGALSATAFWQAGASQLQILSALFTPIGGGYALFFQMWWCSTLVE
ncbi:hypothetical protein [Haloarcula amylolytica]|uniref:hypothetical protein n=1 Tax=Haloarcula amylolytica TaxID=396317 RepID=UPI003C7252C4